MVTHRATLDVPDNLISWLENLIVTRMSELCGFPEKLTDLFLVHLAKGDTFAELCAPVERTIFKDRVGGTGRPSLLSHHRTCGPRIRRFIQLISTVARSA